jgi:hypothetical protein
VWRGCAEDHVAVLTARERAAPGIVNSEGLVRLVYYSLASFGKQKYERQWVQSIRSLRAHNKSVPVHLVHYNAPSDSMLREAERQSIMLAIIVIGWRRRCLDVPAHWFITPFYTRYFHCDSCR